MKGYPKTILREDKKLSLFTESATIRPVKTLTESKDGGRKWECDVWKLGEVNLNGRIYTRELAERLCKEGVVTTVNDGHLQDWITGKEYECAKAVASNLRIEGNVLKCDLTFLSSEKEYEEKLAELSSLGVSIGVSSVGFGEYEPDGKTVKADTYEMVRVVDFVTQPAGEVYATYGGADDNDEPEETPEEEPEEKPDEDDTTDEADNSDDDEEKEPIEDDGCVESSEKYKAAIKDIVRRYMK